MTGLPKHRTDNSLVIPIYDDSFEIRLKSLCILDDNPKLCTNPVEESQYLNVTLYTSEDGFQQELQSAFDHFITYLNDYARSCSHIQGGQTPLLPLLARLSMLYDHAESKFKESPLRSEWYFYSNNFVIHNPKNDYLVDKKQKYTRNAYQFFSRCSGIQLYFIVRTIKYLTVLLQANSNNKDLSSSAEIIQETDSERLTTKKEYIFKINPAASTNTHTILQNIHLGLKDANYIKCTLPEFNQLFLSKNPKPIVWMKDYVHLTYFIKELSKTILLKPKSPSNYEVATKYFYNKESGVYFIKNKMRHDKDPNETDKNVIFRIINNSTINIISIRNKS